jgi:hypothetical protein
VRRTVTGLILWLRTEMLTALWEPGPDREQQDEGENYFNEATV